MDISSIHNIEVLENMVQMIAINIKNSWLKHFKNINITKHSKVWWNDDCYNNLHQFQGQKDWKYFKKTVKRSKHAFFNNKIIEIANKKCSLWKLMNLVKKWKLLAIESIQFNSWSCIKLSDLCDILHNSFNSAQSSEVDFQLLDEIHGKETKVWALFLREELINTIEKCNNSLASSPDKLF